MDHEKFKIELEEIAAKPRDPNTPEDELIGILADILVEAFLAQHKKQNDPILEKAPQVKKRAAHQDNLEESTAFYL